MIWKQIFFICFIIIFTNCNSETLDMNKKVFLEIEVFPTGGVGENYSIKIYNNSTGYSEHNEKEIGDFDKIEIVKVYTEKKFVLNKKEFKTLKSIIDKLDKFGNYDKKKIIKGGWEALIKTEKIEILINLYDEDNPVEIDNLINLIKQLSPIEIKTRSFS